jgi:hypothetical protein
MQDQVVSQLKKMLSLWNREGGCRKMMPMRECEQTSAAKAGCSFNLKCSAKALLHPNTPGEGLRHPLTSLRAGS